MPVCAPRTAALRSASAKMMLGLLPPSSRVTRLFVSAAIFMICRPTSVDPVNEILSTSGWRTSAAPAVEPPPVTTLNAPAGNPASSAISAKSRAVSGVSDAGLRTTGHPAALAGGETAPRRRLEARFGSANRVVDVGRIARRDLGQHFFGRGVLDGETLPRGRRAPLVINKKVGLHFPLNSATRFSL